MAVSEAQKKASNKYNAEHMATLGCKVHKTDAEKFKNYAKEQGCTANSLLRRFVYRCIGKDADNNKDVI